MPAKANFKNNKSALEYWEFVDEAVSELLKTGAVQPSTDPHVAHQHGPPPPPMLEWHFE
jgi:hypothetical protein